MCIVAYGCTLMRDEFESCLPLCSVCVTQSIFQSVAFKLFLLKGFIFDENVEIRENIF